MVGYTLVQPRKFYNKITKPNLEDVKSYFSYLDSQKWKPKFSVTIVDLADCSKAQSDELLKMPKK